MRALSLALQPRSETLLLWLLLLLLLPLPWWHAGAIKDYRIEYNPDLHSHSFEGLAKKLRIMDDEKAVREFPTESCYATPCYTRVAVRN